MHPITSVLPTAPHVTSDWQDREVLTEDYSRGQGAGCVKDLSVNLKSDNG